MMTVKTLTKWLLPLSLAINVFLGAVIATHLGPPRFRPPAPPNPAEMADRMAESLSPADALALRQAFAKVAPPSALGDPGAFHARLRAALDAPSFDTEALQRDFAEMSKAHAVFDEQMAAAIIEAAAKMSPEGRRKLANGRGPGFGPPPPPPPPH